VIVARIATLSLGGIASLSPLGHQGARRPFRRMGWRRLRRRQAPFQCAATPAYEAALERVDLKAGQRVLDIGCGAGAFLRLVTDHGARAFGLDASGALIELAHPPARGRPARREMEALPYDDGTFDLVTGSNAFLLRQRHGRGAARGGAGGKAGGARGDPGLGSIRAPATSRR
jgi:SAM-dependent methyltransferase